MFNVMKSSCVMKRRSSGNWKLLFSEVFCCNLRADPLLSPKKSLSYETFTYNAAAENEDNEVDQYDDDKDTTAQKSGNENETKSIVEQPKPALELGLSPSQPNAPAVLAPSDTNGSLYDDLSIKGKRDSKLASHFNLAEATFASDSKSSGICSLLSSEPTSMDFTESLSRSKSTESGVHSGGENEVEEEDVKVTEASVEASENTQKEIVICEDEVDKIAKVLESVDLIGENIAATTSILAHAIDVDELESKLFESASIVAPIVCKQTTTDEELLQVISQCSSPLDVLACVHLHSTTLSPILSVACIHHIYLKTLAKYPRNSTEYNKLCGEVLTNRDFRDLVFIIETNVKFMNNFALLTAASDLLYLRLTLKQSTIPVLLSHIEFESMDLDELRLLASCLHTPNISLINSEYMYNVSASVAMRCIDQIQDLYTLLNIMKCFGRYFTNAAKRKCEGGVAGLSTDLEMLHPDGRSMAAHMFDAFYRMEHAPARPLLQKASDAITDGNIPVQPQDISAVLRYCVKFGYTIHGHKLLDVLSNAIYERLPFEHASQFTTNVKWLTVFYYYNQSMLERFVGAVKKNMANLDFVALSDILDSLAQVYFLPKNAEEFFEQLHMEMLRKLPTLKTSHVHNANRKLLLTAFHFAVFGRYPETLIKLTLEDKQFINNRSGSRFFMKDLCKAVSIERPDLLPSSIPSDLFMDAKPPQIYAFEKDVRHFLTNLVGGYHNYNLISSPVRNFPVFLLRMRLDGELLPATRHPSFIPPHMHQMIQNVAVVPLPRSRFCIDSRHAIGKTRLVLRLLRAQGARVVVVPHFEWDGQSSARKLSLLRTKIFMQRADDVVE
nr:uncharacterized protein LOC100177535 [Ciona intestinalis]|eukprot:XP_018671125.1 uncharacterized protein LOC100177535 [Ciona intestinalis]